MISAITWYIWDKFFSNDNVNTLPLIIAGINIVSALVIDIGLMILMLKAVLS